MTVKIKIAPFLRLIKKNDQFALKIDAHQQNSSIKSIKSFALRL